MDGEPANSTTPRTLRALLACCAIFAVVGCASWFSYHSTVVTLETQQQQALDRDALAQCERARRTLEGTVLTLEAWADQSLMSTILDDDADGYIGDLLRGGVRRLPIGSDVACLDTSGVVVASARSDGNRVGAELERRTLEAFSPERGPRARIEVDGPRVVVTVPAWFQFDTREQIGALQARFPIAELIAPTGLDYVALVGDRGQVTAFGGDGRLANSDFRRAFPLRLESGVESDELSVVVAESSERATAQISVVRRICLLLALATAACVVLIVVVFVRGERALAAQLAQRAAELERSNGDLARSEENLRLQTQRAEASSRAKGDFLANMSHEIRTPMNGVIGVTELLLGTPLTEEQREYAETIRKSGDSLLTIIDDILDFSKIEAGKLTIESVEFDPRAEIEDAVELVGDRAATKGIELSCAIAPDFPERVRGDPTRMRQILLNLLSNAIKFTERGEISVRAVVEPAGESEFVLGVQVKDSGIGIPADVLPRLFRSFTQADGSTTRRFGGTGLGLAISRELARRMGGEMHVTSEPGAGSTFGFTVRVGRAAEVPAKPASAVDASVLCVDDHALCREIVELYLAPSVRRVASVASAREALDLLALDSDFDVLLIDLRMPGMSGEELLAVLPAVSRAKRILMTAHKQALGPQSLALVHGVIHKPLRRSTLLREIARVHSREPVEAPGAPLPSRAAGDVRFTARVLLVEDNLVNLKVARRMLERHGCVVETAGNGREAIERMAGERFDLVFMDGQMPELDGYEATRRWRELEARRGDPRAVIVAMTAHAMAGDRERCLEAGMDDYLKKPIRDADLLSALMRWLRPAADSSAA